MSRPVYGKNSPGPAALEHLLEKGGLEQAFLATPVLRRYSHKWALPSCFLYVLKLEKVRHHGDTITL